MKKKRVFVGISGGVDSALSAKLLQMAGYEVVGVFIRTWHPDFLVCNEEEERRDAMRVAAFLDIPFLTFDLEDVYKKEVGEHMINEYKLGRTPNPDVMCNKYVKFGAFLKQAISLGADYVATGHYAQKETYLATEPPSTLGDRTAKSGVQLLKKGKDISKDQSYFLYTLRQDQLSKILFPVGHLEKSKVRKLAKEYNLPVAEKKDSQGVCFLGDIDIKDFLKHYIKEKRGRVLDEKGVEVGYHDGVFFHTLGERHGFTITKKTAHDMPYYVIAKDLKKNILIVSHEKSISKNDNKTIKINNLTWVSDKPQEGKVYTTQVRYHGELLSCQIKYDSSRITSVFFEKTILVAPGQSIVFYDDDICLGGGIVI